MLEQKITFDKFIRWAITALIVAAVIYFVDYLSSVLLPFFVAWLLAYLLHPIVKFVQYKLHVPTRMLSIIVTLVLVTAVVGGVIYLIIPPMIEQFDKLGQFVMRYLHQQTHTSNFGEMVRNWIQNNEKEIERFFHSPDFTETLRNTMPKLFSVIGQTANVIVSIIA